MINNDQDNISRLIELSKKQYTRIAIIISIIIIIVMSLTQSYWINSGITILYDLYPVSKINELDGKIYLIDGEYDGKYLYNSTNTSQKVSMIINTKINCNIKNGYVRLLVTNEPTHYLMNNTIPQIVILKVLEGCKNN